jgi:dipeptidyl aminopeptidase/acylaminoacyl peptidase
MKQLKQALAILIVLTVPVSALAQTMTPYDVARLRSVREAAVSPDGREIAYILEVPRAPFEEETGAAWGELHVVSSEGQTRPFIGGTVSVSRIQWRPGSREISFVARRGDDPTSSLYVISLAGGEARRILTHATDIGAYSWSPDGRQVAYLARAEPPPLAQERVARERLPRVYEEQELATRVWIAAPGAATSAPRMLDLEGSASIVRWSPVGGRLAVALAPTPLIDDEYMNRRVHIVDVAAGRVIAQMENRGKLGQIEWSPDGQQIAVISAVQRNDPKEGRLMVAPATGGNYTDLTPGLQGHVEQFAWRDSNTLVWLASEGVYRTINTIDRRGTGRRILIGGAGPIWDGLSLSADGNTIVTRASTPQHPLEVFVLRSPARATAAAPWQARRLTNHNPWLENIRLAPQEVVTYRARDGLELQGMLIRPLDQQPNRRYPLILTIHGGPEAHYSNGWLTSYSLPGQVAAARGFAVFYPNYRGSTGRGLEFTLLSQGDPAGAEFDDFVDGADHLINAGLADRARIGVTGGSYGGFATAWASTYYTERFAAGVMFVGIADLVTMVGAGDIPTEMFHVHLPVWPWENPQLMRDRSPLTYVQQARTPLLILHGEDDTRVHPVHSLMLYRYLKILDQTPVRLVLYPGEGHGLRRSMARLDYNLRMLQWFEHYLQGPGGAAPPPEINLRPEQVPPSPTDAEGVTPPPAG